MTSYVEIFSNKSYEILKQSFEDNKTHYINAKTSKELWDWTNIFLNKNGVTSPSFELQHYPIPGSLDSVALYGKELGLYLYKNLGTLDYAIQTSCEFWSLLSHKYLLQCYQPKIKKNYFFFISSHHKAFNRCLASRAYITTRWTDEMLQEDRASTCLFSDLSLEKALSWTDRATDPIMNMIERATFSSATLRNVIISFLLERRLHPNGDIAQYLSARGAERQFWPHLFRWYGGAMLEALPYEELYHTIKSQLPTIFVKA